MRYLKISLIFVISMVDSVGIDVYMSNITILKIIILGPLAAKPLIFQSYSNFKP